MQEDIKKLNALLDDSNDDEELFELEDEELEEEIVEPVKKPRSRGRKPSPQPEEKPSQPVISEAFEAFSKQLEEENKIQEEQKELTLDDILGKIEVNLDEIEIMDATEISDLVLFENQETVLSDSKTMQVVCCQSGYAAHLSPLKNQEIQNLIASDLDLYNFKKRVYRTVYNHIQDSSVGKMDFNTWLKVTSYFDIDTLLYGVYCQTFPYENKYPLTCPRCDRGFNTIVNNNTLIETRGQEADIYAKINEVVANIKDPKLLLEHSHVHTTKRVMLEQSKIIFDIIIPSAHDYLEGILANASDQFIEEYSTSLGIALFIDKVLIPDLKGYKATGKLKYIPVTNKGRIIDIVSKLPYYDGLDLSDKVNEFTNKYKIVYSIKNIKCPECGFEFPNLPMNLEDILFMAIRRGKRN